MLKVCYTIFSQALRIQEEALTDAALACLDLKCLLQVGTAWRGGLHKMYGGVMQENKGSWLCPMFVEFGTSKWRRCEDRSQLTVWSLRCKVIEVKDRAVVNDYGETLQDYQCQSPNFKVSVETYHHHLWK
eukprot:GHVO01002929.1.p1 GENE.GHVO01002929.1~~GHVO01002929.1.p1  ORF type:complete len:130 (+),score=7.38 GHVO01002929.1:83-472(+)